jgi:AP-3 complex subunit mu
VEPGDVPPTIHGGRHHLINCFNGNLYLVAAVKTDVPTLFVVEFLHRVFTLFDDYFGKATEGALMKHTVIAIQLLEEMLDNGFPLATEPNVLKEMIRPPTWTAMFDSVTGNKNVREKLPSGTISNTQWRRAGVKYSNNECFVDIEENIDFIVDKNGSIVFSEVRGSINCRTKLSGMPDLMLSFVNPRVLDDPSFHPCVRLTEWTNSRVLSFIPPDGFFTLANYIIGPEVALAIPLKVRPVITFDEGHGKLELEISPQSTGGKIIEDLIITIPMPKQVNSVSLTPSVGICSFDQVEKVVRWEVKKLPVAGLSSIRGTISCSPGTGKLTAHPTVSVGMRVAGYVPSGVKVNRLDVTCEEKYKPFKGVKYTAKAGRYQIRT